MASYEETLQRAMDAYPELFPKESYFLRHAFFILGNGYRWKNGELVSRGPDDPVEIRKQDIAGLRREVDSKLESLLAEVGSLLEEVGDDTAKSLFFSEYEPASVRLQRMIDEGDNWPIFERNRQIIKRKDEPKRSLRLDRDVANLPDDITLDWLQAACHAYALAIGGHWTTTENDEKLLSKFADRLNELSEKHLLLIMAPT